MYSSIIYCIAKCQNSSKRKTRIKTGICGIRTEGTLCHPTQLARDSTLYFLFSNGKSIFYRPVSRLFMLIYISIVRIEMPNKSNNILNVSQIDLQFAYTQSNQNVNKITNHCSPSIFCVEDF